jgi:hypothetical protein
MRVINVIATKQSDGSVISVDSFGVFEEQLSDDVSEAAEKLFTEKCESAGIAPDEIEDAISDGYVEIEDDEGDIMLSIVWSDI